MTKNKYKQESAKLNEAESCALKLTGLKNSKVELERKIQDAEAELISLAFQLKINKVGDVKIIERNSKYLAVTKIK